MIDFEQCVDDVSVDHPHVVENYASSGESVGDLTSFSQPSR
jgi:hypothetical protein